MPQISYKDSVGNTIKKDVTEQESVALKNSAGANKFTFLEDSPKVVYNSNSVRDAESVIKSDANNLYGKITDLDTLQNETLKNLLSSTTFNETPQGQQSQSELDALRKSLGIITSEEQAQIDEAGVQAGYAYDPLITQSQEEKRKGLPKALIGAGERGGLMNSQFAGAAALGPTEGGDFFGAGGKLEDIKGVYDRNINMLQAQKAAAISAAKSAAQTALKTGKQTDYELALKAFDSAQKAHNDAITLANEKLQVITNFQNQQQKNVQFSQDQEDRLASIVAPNMVDVDEQGNIILPTPEEITAMADDYGIDSNLLIKMINEQSAGLSKMLASERKAALEEQKIIKDLNSRDTQVVTANGRTKLIDTQTGEVLVDLGSAYKGTNTEKSILKMTPEELLAQGIKEGEVFQEKGKFYIMDVGGNIRTATTAEVEEAGGGLTPEEEKFQKDINGELDKLAKGGEWGDSWNYIMNKYGEQGLTTEQLDELLNKSKYYPK